MNKYFILSVLGLILGLLFYAINNELLIFKVYINRYQPIITNNQTQKKIFKIYYPTESKLEFEEKELIESADRTQILNNLIKSWLDLSQEEKFLTKNLSLQAILTNYNTKDIYISFDKNLFNKQDNVYHKLLIIESLLQTLFQTCLDIKKVFFLVNHKPMADIHLDFNKPWPISGFINK